MVDLWYCNLVGKVIGAFEDLNEIWMSNRMQAVVELEMIDEFAMVLEGCWGALILHIVAKFLALSVISWPTSTVTVIACR